MNVIRRWRRQGLTLAVIGALVAQTAQPASAVTNHSRSDWTEAVARIPATSYTRDAKTYIREAVDGLRPHVDDKVRTKLLDPVLGDLDERYLDGVRFRGVKEGDAATKHLRHLVSYVKSRLTGHKLPPGEARRAHVAALVGLLTGGRLIADGAIQDAEATLAPVREADGAAVQGDPELIAAFLALAKARAAFAIADQALRKAQPEPAAVHQGHARSAGVAVLNTLDITYEGDHDTDGATDLVELRLGTSPLVKDSDGDELTDKFEVYELVGWSRATDRDTDDDGVLDGAEDLDGDGLSNLDEQTAGTSPTEPDTERDGVTDGDETRRGTDPLTADARAPPVAGDTRPLDLSPTDTDADGDGLENLAEGEEETDPNNPDSDGDGLSDGDEVIEHSISPLKADSDGDGLGDGYEVAHRDDQGLDPGRPDEQVSKWTYVKDFLLGLFAGDFAPRDSLAWLSGYLCSGGLSLIPVVGWILGGLADIRDTIAGLINGDWVGAGLSILGVVPYVGDAVAIPGKAARFVARYVHRLSDAIRFVARYDRISDSVKTLAIRAMLLGDYGRLTDAGFTDGSILRLARGERTDLRRIAEAMQNTRHVAGPRVPFLNNARAGEDHLVNVLLAGRAGTPQFRINTPGVPRPGSYRVLDYAEQTPTGGIVAHEVKTGTSRYGSEVGQCEKDAHLIRTGQVAGVLWHFVPHARFNSLGPSQELLDCLLSNGINFTIHPPA